MLDEQQIRDLVTEHGATVNQGRPIKQIIEDGDMPRLSGATVLEGKVSDSVFRENLVTKAGQPIRLMFRNNRISTHDVNRGAIPFKDQVLAFNHDHMLNLVKDVLGSSQFHVEGLLPSSTVIPAEKSESDYAGKRTAFIYGRKFNQYFSVSTLVGCKRARRGNFQLCRS
ncbi:MAG: hypothetical protein CM1200mP40_19750 [Gammaproteobacteria bacterium]|nr:MAG: hypothetical protein CM1200mP40_19750 [Gammaproteobacteria bacterium]